MRDWRGCLLAVGLLELAGCAAGRGMLSEAEAVKRLQTGLPVVSCRAECVGAWRQAQPRAAQLDAARQWAALAALVIGVGYQDDLTLYYLGRAGEGIGYPGAAASYYRQSTYISGTSLSCIHASGVCGGVALPRAAHVRLAAIERALHPVSARPGGAGRTARPGMSASDAAPPPAEPEFGVTMPTAAAITPAATSHGLDYIEPPPARR